MRPVRWMALPALVGFLVLVAGCDPLRDVVEGPRGTAHERYGESLREAGLDRRALGAAWLAAADRALREPLPVTLPFRETGFFAGDAALARGYRIVARRGERLVVTVEAEAEPVTAPAGEDAAAAGEDGVQHRGPLVAGLFVDLFRVEPAEDPAWDHLESGDSVEMATRHEIDEDGTYLLRLQPELLRPVRYTLTVEVEPTLAFPVQDRDAGDIRSGFGADRDAGRRVHHGVDIFAPRGTPVLAAAEGRVEVGTNRLGGNVVWQRVAGLGALYYAHLDSQAIDDGAVARPGDTLGFVGNTGNAVTTPPHLHFGIYARPGGPVDPFPFIYVPDQEPPDPLAGDVALGTRVRTTERAFVRAGPAAGAPVLDTLPAGTIGTLAGGAGTWRRIELADRTAGFVRAADLMPATTPVRTIRLPAPAELRTRPSPDALALITLPTDAEISILGTHGDWLRARATDATEGWLLPRP